MGVLVIAAVIGGIGLFVGAIWVLVIAFKESIGCGLLYIFFPYYSLYYVLTRWDETKRAFFVCLAGLALFVGGLVPILMQA